MAPRSGQVHLVDLEALQGVPLLDVVESDISFYDGLPVASQLKSLYQLARSDRKGAGETQSNFTRTCVIIAQVRYTKERFWNRDKLAGEETNSIFRYHLKKRISSFVNGLPIIGHVSGVYHYRRGNVEKGDNAMIYATRGIGVFAGGAFGALLTLNPAGAILGATGGGALYDGLATSIAYFVKNKYTPIGLFECFPAVYYTRKNPAANFDAIASVLTTLANDGLFGMAIFKAMKGLGFIKIPEKAAVGSAASSAELAVTTATTEVATASSELAGTTATTEVATASPELAGTTATTEVAAATTSDGGGIPLKNASAVIGEAEAVSRVGAIAPDIACAIGGVCAEAVVNSAHCERTQGLRSPAGSECIVCYERKPAVVFVPCTHLHLCLECAKRINLGDPCPTCRMPVQFKIDTVRLP